MTTGLFFGTLQAIEVPDTERYRAAIVFAPTPDMLGG